MILILLPPISTLFPYTTLFRSAALALMAAATGLPASPAHADIDAECSARSFPPNLDMFTLVFFEVNGIDIDRSEEHTSELQSRRDLVCRLLLEKKKKKQHYSSY